MQHEYGFLLLRLHRDIPHDRPVAGLADRFGIRRVVLLPLDGKRLNFPVPPEPRCPTTAIDVNMSTGVDRRLERVSFSEVPLGAPPG